MTLINNAHINVINDLIDVNDRGLAYGDGIFETIAYVNGVLHNWPLHWQRINRGAERLSLIIPDEEFLVTCIHDKIKQYTNLDDTNSDDQQQIKKQVIKIIISRGSGGRGYQFPQTAQSSLIINLHHWPDRCVDDYKTGINVKICQTCLAQQPALAGIKHLNRLEQVLARNELNDGHFHDGLLLACTDNVSDMNAHVIEATSSNLFFVKNKQLFTPKIDTCGVQGTIRQEILQRSEKMAIKLEQGHYTLHDLIAASEIFLSNSIFGLVPVASISLNESRLWTWSQRSPRGISARLSRHINSALNRPDLF